MDRKFLEEKGLLNEANRFNYIMEYVTSMGDMTEADANADGLDDATGLADPTGGAAGGGMPGAGGPMGGGAPMGGAPAAGADPMAGAQDPAMAGAAGGDPNGAGGVPGFDPAASETDTPPTAQESYDEAMPDAGGEDDEVIDVDELVDQQEENKDAIQRLTDKFDQFMGKFQEFQGELKANADFMAKLEGEFEKRNPTSIEKMTMRSLQSKPFQETPEEYMEYDAPENYSPEDDNNGVGEPRYTITRDDVKNATDYSSIAKTLRDNGNATLKTLLGL